MHSALIQQLAADRVRELHAKARDEHRAHQARLARRDALATPPELPACATPSLPTAHAGTVGPLPPAEIPPGMSTFA